MPADWLTTWLRWLSSVVDPPGSASLLPYVNVYLNGCYMFASLTFGWHFDVFVHCAVDCSQYKDGTYRRWCWCVSTATCQWDAVDLCKQQAVVRSRIGEVKAVDLSDSNSWTTISCQIRMPASIYAWSYISCSVEQYRESSDFPPIYHSVLECVGKQNYEFEVLKFLFCVNNQFYIA